MLRLFRKRPPEPTPPNAHLTQVYWSTHRELERLLAEPSKRLAA